MKVTVELDLRTLTDNGSAITETITQEVIKAIKRVDLTKILEDELESAIPDVVREVLENNSDVYDSVSEELKRLVKQNFGKKLKGKK